MLSMEELHEILKNANKLGKVDAMPEQSANQRQVAGSHYTAHGRNDIQHWDVVAIFGLGYFEGQATKYLFRWKYKNGLEDLLKARHYLDKLIELETAKEANNGA